jgi:hypothetical protein
MAGLKHPVTPDGRHFVVRGKLWRLANPGLSAAVRSALVRELMAARSAVRSAKLSKDLIRLCDQSDYADSNAAIAAARACSEPMVGIIQRSAQ